MALIIEIIKVIIVECTVVIMGVIIIRSQIAKTTARGIRQYTEMERSMQGIIVSITKNIIIRSQTVKTIVHGIRRYTKMGENMHGIGRCAKARFVRR